MSTVVAPCDPSRFPGRRLRRDPAAEAFMLLRIAFTVAPILFGIDSSPRSRPTTGRAPRDRVQRHLPGNAADAMYLVGIIEIARRPHSPIAPRFGGVLVALWPGGMIVDPLLVGGYGDIARATSACPSAPTPSPASRAPTPGLRLDRRLGELRDRDLVMGDIRGELG